MIFVISNNQALPSSKSTPVLITVCSLDQQCWVSPGAGQKSRTSGPTLALRNQNMHFNMIPQVICMQGFEKLCFSFVEIYLSVTAAYFLYGEPHGRWPPASHSSYEKSTWVLGILVGGSFQPITGQLMQLLAAIIGHHSSPDVSGICTQVFNPFLQWRQVLSQKCLFSFLLHHSIFTRMEKLWIIIFFLKWAATAFLKVECTCHSTACNCSKSCRWPGDYYSAECYYFPQSKCIDLDFIHIKGKKSPDNEIEF